MYQPPKCSYSYLSKALEFYLRMLLIFEYPYGLFWYSKVLKTVRLERNMLDLIIFTGRSLGYMMKGSGFFITK